MLFPKFIKNAQHFPSLNVDNSIGPSSLDFLFIVLLLSLAAGGRTLKMM
jgi:hypothetical protein